MVKADSLKLWDSTRWKRILFYRDHFYGEESDVDGGFFFLSPNGKTDPRSEMRATLRGFFHKENLYAALDTPLSNAMHPQIKFPLRRQFLQSSLGIPDTAFAPIDLTRFEKWIAALDPEYLSVVFAAAYLGNPASAMGHTFLRVHSKHNSGQRELLDYGINYAGVTPPGENTLMFSIKGVAGLYPGTFGLLPYYVSLQKYLHIENRDLWYYHLNLNEQQQWAVLAHLWELGTSWEHYFFFTENCSFFLAELIEIALPDSAELMDALPYAMVPIEIIKKMQAIPGLVDSVTWRPPTLVRVRERYNTMSAAQKALTHAFLFEDTTQWSNAIAEANLGTEDLAFVYDASLDYSLAQKRKQGIDTVWGKRNDALRQRRTAIHLMPRDVHYEVDTTQQAPHRIHDPYRVELGAGAQESQAFGIVGFRLSYQDLNQFDEGLKPNNVLDFMDLHFRIQKGQKFRLESFRVIQLGYFSTVNDVKYPLSFRVDARMDRPPMKAHLTGNDPLSPYGALAGGKSWDFWGRQVLVGYGLLGARLRLHPEYDYYTSFGPMLNSGLKWRPINIASLLLSSEMTYNAVGKRGWELHHEAELRIGGPSLELRFAGSSWNHRNEGAVRFLVNY